MNVSSGKAAIKGWGLEAFQRDLELAEKFTIATISWEVASNVFVRVRYDGFEGIGEVAPDERWGDSPASTVGELSAVEPRSLGDPFDLESVLELLPAGATRCALDIARHDLAAKLAGVSVAELLGLGGRSLPATSVTVPIAEVDAMVERAGHLADHPCLKLKVGFEGDVDAVAAIRSAYNGIIRIDANEGWTVDQAIQSLRELEAFDIELCEQPIPRNRLDELRRVTEATSIPVFADEDVSTASDVAKLAGVVDGVNLKLRKTGGMREALRAISTARALGLGVMLGCDLTSGVSATAEASIASLVDYADIDGPLLLASDPHPGVTYDNGKLTLPRGPGLGVRDDGGQPLTVGAS
jgi:L-alanine-DL-glutamate epimerase-like enolase superfamily enzyme